VGLQSIFSSMNYVNNKSENETGGQYMHEQLHGYIS
jgi:hypothetical protein